nr:hypothetical protein [Enterobacter roggenkampii]
IEPLSKPSERAGFGGDVKRSDHLSACSNKLADLFRTLSTNQPDAHHRVGYSRPFGSMPDVGQLCGIAARTEGRTISRQGRLF